MVGYGMRESEPGKWVIGAGFMALGFIIIVASIALAISVQPLYGILSAVGVYLNAVIIHDQVVRNWRLIKK